MEPAISLLPLGKERPLSLEFAETHAGGLRCLVLEDRKSTRLNSSHRG